LIPQGRQLPCVALNRAATRTSTRTSCGESRPKLLARKGAGEKRFLVLSSTRSAATARAASTGRTRRRCWERSTRARWQAERSWPRDALGRDRGGGTGWPVGDATSVTPRGPPAIQAEAAGAIRSAEIARAALIGRAGRRMLRGLRPAPAGEPGDLSPYPRCVSSSAHPGCPQLQDSSRVSPAS
jgi:hypothetical protein